MPKINEKMLLNLSLYYIFRNILQKKTSLNNSSQYTNKYSTIQAILLIWVNGQKVTGHKVTGHSHNYIGQKVTINILGYIML